MSAHKNRGAVVSMTLCQNYRCGMTLDGRWIVQEKHIAGWKTLAALPSDSAEPWIGIPSARMEVHIALHSLATARRQRAVPATATALRPHVDRPAIIR